MQYYMHVFKVVKNEKNKITFDGIFIIFNASYRYNAKKKGKKKKKTKKLELNHLMHFHGKQFPC